MQGDHPRHDPGAVRQELYRLPGVAQEQTRDVVHHRRQSLLPGLRPARGKRRGCGSGSTFRTKTCATGGRSAEWRQPGAPTSPWYGVSGSPRERRSDSIRLEAGAVDIISAKGWIRVPRGYHVLRKDGIRTGLAIAPWVEEKQGELVVTPGSWVITHLSSGLAMTQPYSSVAEARLLASILAQIDWRRPTEAISRREMEATRQVIKGYNEALVEVMARSGDRALAGSFMQPADLFQHSS
jgi:hypothetical protein